MAAKSEILSLFSMLDNTNDKISSFRSMDSKFMPLNLTHGRHYLFVLSFHTEQVMVFHREQQKGVLKMHGSKIFNAPRAVHFIRDDNNAQLDVLVVLDKKGFHLFSEVGELICTLMEDEGAQYRGLGNVVKDNNLYIVSLDIKKSKLVLINCTKGSPDFGKVCKRYFVQGSSPYFEMLASVSHNFNNGNGYQIFLYNQSGILKRV